MSKQRKVRNFGERSNYVFPLPPVNLDGSTQRPPPPDEHISSTDNYDNHGNLKKV